MANRAERRTKLASLETSLRADHEAMVKRKKEREAKRLALKQEEEDHRKQIARIHDGRERERKDAQDAAAALTSANALDDVTDEFERGHDRTMSIGFDPFHKETNTEEELNPFENIIECDGPNGDGEPEKPVHLGVRLRGTSVRRTATGGVTSVRTPVPRAVPAKKAVISKTPAKATERRVGSTRKKAPSGIASPPTGRKSPPANSLRSNTHKTQAASPALGRKSGTASVRTAKKKDDVSSIASSQDQADELQRETDMLKEEVTALKSELMQAQTELEAVDMLRQQCDDLQQELIDTRQQLTETEALNTELQAIKSELDDVASVHNDLASKEADLADVKNQLQRALAGSKEMEQKYVLLERSKETSTVSAAELALLKRQLSHTKETEAQLNMQIVELLKQLDKAKQASSAEGELQAQVTFLTKAHEEAVKNLAIVHDDLDVAEMKLEKANETMDNLRAELQQAQQALSVTPSVDGKELQAERNDLECALQQARRAHELQQQEQASQVEALQARIKTLQELAASDDGAGPSKELASLRHQVEFAEVLEEECGCLREQVSKLEDEVKQLKGQSEFHSLLEDELEQSRIELEKAQAAKFVAQSNSEAEVRAARKQLEAQERELEQLRGQLANTIRQSAESSVSSNTVIAAELVQARASIEALQDQLADALEESIKNKEDATTAEELQKELEKAKQKMTELKQGLAAATHAAQEAPVLRQQTKTLQNRLEQAQAEVAALKKSQEEAQAEIIRLKKDPAIPAVALSPFTQNRSPQVPVQRTEASPTTQSPTMRSRAGQNVLRRPGANPLLVAAADSSQENAGQAEFLQRCADLAEKRNKTKSISEGNRAEEGAGGAADDRDKSGVKFDTEGDVVGRLAERTALGNKKAVSTRTTNETVDTADRGRSLTVPAKATGSWKPPVNPSCGVCGNAVYAMEKLEADEKTYHKQCFRCAECNKTVALGTYAALQGKIYCKPHFKQLFKLKGNYDEGFGAEQHKYKWINKDGLPEEDSQA